MHCKIEHSMIAVTACSSQLNPDDVNSLLFLNGLSNEYACSSEVAFLVLSFEDIGNGFNFLPYKLYLWTPKTVSAINISGGFKWRMTRVVNWFRLQFLGWYGDNDGMGMGEIFIRWGFLWGWDGQFFYANGTATILTTVSSNWHNNNLWCTTASFICVAAASLDGCHAMTDGIPANWPTASSYVYAGKCS